VQILDFGVAVVVADEDADAAAQAATELRGKGDGSASGTVSARRAAVFVLDPGSGREDLGLREFCHEQFGAEP
jgi:hypothetical protein